MQRRSRKKRKACQVERLEREKNRVRFSVDDWDAALKREYRDEYIVQAYGGAMFVLPNLVAPLCTPGDYLFKRSTTVWVDSALMLAAQRSAKFRRRARSILGAPEPVEVRSWKLGYAMKGSRST